MSPREWDAATYDGGPAHHHAHHRRHRRLGPPRRPADIDETYVQTVVDALFAVDAQATKIFVETGEVDEEGVDILRSIYTEEEVDREVNA